MTISEVNQVQSRMQEILRQRKLLAPLVNRFNFPTSQEYITACVTAGLAEDADETDAEEAIKKTVVEANKLPKVTMKDFLAWKNSL